MIRKIINWFVFPSTSQSRERERFLRKFEEGLPGLIRHYERKNDIQKDDKEDAREIVEGYRAAYRQAEASDRANVTLGQANRFKNAQLERDIIRLENAVGGFE